MNDTSIQSHPGSDTSAQEIQRLRDAVQRLEESEALQRALFAIADCAGAGLELPRLLAQLHAIIGALMPAENFYIALHDAQASTLTFVYFADVDSSVPPLGQAMPMANFEHGLTWYVISDARPLRGSLQEMALLVSGPFKPRGSAAKDWLGVPMLEGEQVCGALVVQSYTAAGIYGEREQALLSFVARHVLTALQRQQAHEALEKAVLARTAELRAEVAERQRGERLQAALYRIGELAAADTDSQVFHREVHTVVASLLHAANYFVALLSDDEATLNFPYYVDETRDTQRSRPLGRGATEYVLRSGQPLLLDAAGINVLVASGEIQLRGVPSQSWLGVPLRCEGRTLGVLAVQSYDARRLYDERDRELLLFVSHQIANSLQRRAAVQALRQANAELEERVLRRTQELRLQISERERIERQLQHEVVHDALTGLPNRKYLFDRLERLFGRFRRDPSQPFAVMFMDIDRFKLINDSLGHGAGDVVLRAFSGRLSVHLRAPDFVARLSGDEFAVLVEDGRDADALAHLAQRLLAEMQQPIEVEGRRLVVTSSIGIAVARSEMNDVEALLRCADAAMYRAKSAGRHRFEFHDEALQDSSLGVLNLEAELKQALAQRQFLPFFQPVIRVQDGSVRGCEVLMRWQHPQRGLLTPGDFLAVAEECGCIEAIDWQIFEQAMQAVSAATSYTGVLGLNVPPRHLRREDFAQRLLVLACRHGLEAQRLCIEVTEGSLIDDPQEATVQLKLLRDAGAGVALDDFGVGYSSLGQLHRLPLTTLKIDRQFVNGLGGESPQRASQAVVCAVVAMARSLEISVVAEGVETAAQHEAVKALGCQFVQGYYYARPGPVLPTD
ncbi:MAG: EAL domain-containing protein [Inhella sp.]